jgi:putative thioredoxin
MSASPHIFDVGAADFAEKVLRKSGEVPILVDFWASWCGPCQALEPILEQVAEHFAGRLLIARVDTDAEQGLAAQFGVRSLPTLLVFSDGQVRTQATGVQPESAIKALVAPFARTPADELAEKGIEAMTRGDMEDAQALLEEAVMSEPDRPGPRFALAEVYLSLSRPDDAEGAIDPLPAPQKESDIGHVLRDRIRFCRDTLSAPPEEELRDRIASRLVLSESLEEALHQFFEIMSRDRGFRDDAGRAGMVSVFNMLDPDSEVVADYRRRMAGLLH